MSACLADNSEATSRRTPRAPRGYSETGSTQRHREARLRADFRAASDPPRPRNPGPRTTCPRRPSGTGRRDGRARAAPAPCWPRASPTSPRGRRRTPSPARTPQLYAAAGRGSRRRRGSRSRYGRGFPEYTEPERRGRRAGSIHSVAARSSARFFSAPAAAQRTSEWSEARVVAAPGPTPSGGRQRSCARRHARPGTCGGGVAATPRRRRRAASPRRRDAGRTRRYAAPSWPVLPRRRHGSSSPRPRRDPSPPRPVPAAPRDAAAAPRAPPRARRRRR